MLREEMQGILYRWIQAAQRFITNGEQLGNMPSSIREATAAMFHEADLHGRLLELLEFGSDSFEATKGEMLGFGESFFRENGRDTHLFDMGKLTALLAEKVGKPVFNIMRDGHRKEGWRGVQLAPGVPVVQIGK
jgi:hypothetical protein